MLENNLAGFSIIPTKSKKGFEYYQINLQIKLAGEFPIDALIEKKEETIHIFDAGSTLHDIMALGIHPFEGKVFSALQHCVQKYGVSLNENGEFEISGEDKNAEGLVRSYIEALKEVSQWIDSQIPK